MNVTVRQVLVEYHEEMVSLGLRPGTVELREGYLRRFVAACDQVKREKSEGRVLQASMAQLDSVSMARFFSGLRGAQGDRNNALTAVRGFLHYAERVEYLRPGTAVKLIGERKIRRAHRRPKHYMAADQFSDALDVAENHHPEDRAIVALALYTLGRQSDILPLQLKHIDLRSRTIQMYRTKMKRWTEMPISPDLFEELSYWLSFYASERAYSSPVAMMRERPDWYLVPKRLYRPSAGARSALKPGAGSFSLVPEAPQAQLERVIKRVLTGLGVELEDGSAVRHRGEGLHMLRRSGARALLDHLAVDLGQDKALLRVSTMLDHENPQQTLLYIGREIERKQLNDWLIENPMYGSAQSPRRNRGPGSVTALPAGPSPAASSTISERTLRAL